MAVSKISKGTFQYYDIPVNTGNWNDFKNIGMYSSFGSTNAPLNNKWFLGIVGYLTNNPSYAVQLAIGERVFVRINAGAGFSSWKEL